MFGFFLYTAGGMAPPCAKIILIERRPMDVAFGNFKHDADVMMHNWALNLTDISYHIAFTEFVMKIWKDHLPPDSVITVRCARHKPIIGNLSS